MEINILVEFVSLMDTTSFQETAARMNISQSALSKHIHKLEEELGLPLFDRSQRLIKPTEFGTEFYPYAYRIQQIYTEGIASLKKHSHQDKRRFTVAYDPRVGQYGIVDLLSSFSASHPEHRMLAVEDDCCLELLEKQECSFAFVEEESLNEKFSKMIFKTDHLAFILRDDHPLAGEPSLSIEQMKDERFILHSSQFQDRPHKDTKNFLNLCSTAGIEPNIIVESQFTSTILRYVVNGTGVAVLNRHRVSQEYPNLRIIDVEPAVNSYIYLLYPRKISLPGEKDFLHFMIDHCNLE